MSKSRRILFFCATALLLSACTPNREANKRKAYDRSAYESNSCSFSFEEGEKYQNNFSQHQFVKAYFGKVYDRAQVLALLSASAKHMTEYIEASGANLYRVHRSSGGCFNLINLPAPAPALEAFWDSVDAGDSGSQAFVIGLFLPLSKALEFGTDRPVILVRSDADRWTLLHEYMHFLFSSYRQQSHQISERDFEEKWEQVKNQTLAAFAKLDEARLKSDSEYRSKMSSQWLDFIESAQTYLLTYPLEEMVIESILFAHYQDGSFANATNFNRANSIRYIDENYRISKTVFMNYRRVGQLLMSTFPGQNEDEYLRLKAAMVNWDHLAEQADHLHSQYGSMGNKIAGDISSALIASRDPGTILFADPKDLRCRHVTYFSGH